MNDRPALPAPVSLTPVGIIESDFPDKFGIPRQPGLATAARATLVLVPPYDDPLTVRGLSAFSHLWLTFVFHQSPERWTPLVRPPRLGGNTRVGVFASRSTHRPNRLGLSLVELIDIDTSRGVRLTLGGVDLVSGTPVLDIKPYLPWAESRPEARAGFAPGTPPTLAVGLSPEAEAVLARRPDGDKLRELIRQVLAQDPRPAYRRGAEARIYGVRLRDVDVRFQALEVPDGPTRLEVVEIVPA
ncbi:tRNA (N6-threonylcarbamoyladenosine(37)-N6)-methyltransferase TrmO [Halomonas aestuarii]|uniref:tRNA (N6-threonylcarbamoyladenosine(37)-N6)-methyltransferase TrmO n=1 Tax=Halomonas aestuarii TaxID=1897729 RepID=A0A1J0VHE3_9GAMM|nr:tRNA (N6-threonylcarbamoyladenosine(37)-N6)-methyltransferase TrmO [Halomonas aestuarii]APE31429.1 tRNA (N6-threonylcarbamoyladenosine(37)-N6)-methyltransferase TrmO [Halomonas aestuarii]